MSEKSNKKGSAKKSAGCGKKDAAKKEAFKPVSRKRFSKGRCVGRSVDRRYNYGHAATA